MRTSVVNTSKAIGRSAGGTHLLRFARTEYDSLDTVKLARLRTVLLSKAQHTTAHRLVLDLSNVRFFGAGFVGVLVETWKLLDKTGRRLVLCGLTPYSANLIRILNLDRLFDVYPASEAGPGPIRKHAYYEQRPESKSSGPFSLQLGNLHP
jgi:anti-anti-sigma factor